MRSFLARLIGSVTRTVLLAPCLLICLACATPFPIENLEVGMTTETVLQKFGAPEALETKPGEVKSSWTYLHEELEPVPLTVGPMPLRFAVASVLFCVPACWLFALTDVATGDLDYGVSWNFAYVSKAPVVLEFEEEKLVRWAVLGDIRASCGGSGCPEYEDPLPFHP